MVLSRAAVLSTLVLVASSSVINRDSTSKIEARSGWTSLGCYTDNVSGRALTTSMAVTGGTAAMTNELCQSSCLAAGFTISGTEYAEECCK